MSMFSIISMVVNFTIIVGGFGYFLSRAIKNNRIKKDQNV